MATTRDFSAGTKGEEGVETIGSYTLQVPETLKETEEMWGAAVTLSKAIQSVVIDAQSIVRRIAKDPKQDIEKAQETINGFKPAVGSARGSGTSLSALAKKLKDLPAEKREELLAALGV